MPAFAHRRSRRDWPDGRLDTLAIMALLPITEPCDLERNDPPLLALSQSAIARAGTLDRSARAGHPNGFVSRRKTWKRPSMFFTKASLCSRGPETA
jgi:hypothetical protein